ncbi:hypothetical protein LJC36_00670 [Desulfovibrio sp. OttesenSCG-928-C14]|nr:hypothetical protein [Desulfovibrio sp. OttesenSCG-928-C14]
MFASVVARLASRATTAVFLPEKLPARGQRSVPLAKFASNFAYVRKIKNAFNGFYQF